MTDLTEDIHPAQALVSSMADFSSAPARAPLLFVGFSLDPSDESIARALAGSMKVDLPEMFVELLRRAGPHANGKAGYENVCSSCGRTYQAMRRALPGKRNYCPDCRKSGEPAADRARDYRDRKAKERPT